MNSSHFLLIVIAILIGVWLRVKKARISPKKNDQVRQFVSEDTATAKKCLTSIQKNTSLSCLLNDEKIYGEGFKNKVLPPIPCCVGCKCQLIDFMVNNAAFSENETNFGHYRNTDLGELSFLEFKYYKYSIIIMQAEKAFNRDGTTRNQQINDDDDDDNEALAEDAPDKNASNKQLKSYTTTLMSSDDLKEYIHMRNALTIKEDFKDYVRDHLYGEFNELE